MIYFAAQASGKKSSGTSTSTPRSSSSPTLRGRAQAGSPSPSPVSTRSWSAWLPRARTYRDLPERCPPREGPGSGWKRDRVRRASGVVDAFIAARICRSQWAGVGIDTQTTQQPARIAPLTMSAEATQTSMAGVPSMANVSALRSVAVRGAATDMAQNLLTSRHRPASHGPPARVPDASAIAADGVLAVGIDGRIDPCRIRCRLPGTARWESSKRPTS
jgi:hypothetical protein